MNCKNCGGTLSFVAGRGRLRCEFCGTTHFLLDSDFNLDRMTPLAETCDEDCPLCHIPLSLAVLDHVQVRSCTQCRGFLISNSDFAEVVQRRRSEFDGDSTMPEPLDCSELQRRVECPRCFASLDTYPYCGPGSVVIDGCRNCRLIWLDQGEIGAIERAPGKRW